MTNKILRNSIIITYILAVIALMWWYFAPAFVSKHETDAAIDRIKNNASTAERRAADIVDATKRREVTTREKIKSQTQKYNSDALVDALNILLADYRSGSPK